MKSTKKKKVVINDGENLTVAPCKIYRYRVKFANKASPDLMSPPYAFANDNDAMKWVGEMAERLLSDVKAKYTSILCFSFAACDDKGVVTFSDDVLIGVVKREDVLASLRFKIEEYSRV